MQPPRRGEYETPIEAARSLLPSSVAVSGAPMTAPAEPLFDIEAAALGDAVAARRHEFALGRTCARAALAAIEVAPVAIPVGDRRAPVWPPGVVGSIAHTRTVCVAAAARARDLRGLGIDLEEVQEMAPGVVDLVLTPEERDALEPGSELVAFSAKEAVFKLWWPLTGSWLGFEEVSLRVDPGTGTFRAAIAPRAADAPTRLDGRYAVTAGSVVAAVTLP
jgi:4'-phosphopantetheinyl transferase EntD